MIMLRIVLILMLVVVLWVLISQLIIPMSGGRPIFPFLRKQRDLEEELAEIAQEEYETELEREIRERREALEKERAALTEPETSVSEIPPVSKEDVKQ